MLPAALPPSFPSFATFLQLETGDITHLRRAREWKTGGGIAYGACLKAS